MPLQLMSGISAAAGANIGKLFGEAKQLYAPGGGYMAGIEAAISRGSKRAVASGVQQLASVGLAGTSVIGGLGKKYEEEIGMPARSQAVTARLSALSGLLAQEAGVQAQTAPRYGYQPSYGGGGGGGGRRTTIPSVAPRRTTVQPRAVAQPQQQPQQQQLLPSLNFPKTFAPAGQWQGTIGGTGFYATGEGGFTQRQVGPLSGPAVSAPRKRPLSNYYDVGGELGI